MKPLLVSLCCFMICFVSLNGQTLRTHIYSGDKLEKVKARKHTEMYATAVKALLKEADKALKVTPPSVMEKKMVAVSGDKHDYLSMGPYWWPDPSKADGLPYIRKDGYRNPELAKLDRNRLGKMAKSVVTLGLAYYFSDDERYAKKAVDFLKVWFLNADTKMNPHLNYGQTVPGHNNGLGRGVGLIDTYCLVEMLDVLNLLDVSKAMDTSVRKGLKQWFTQFVEWMQTSPVAAEEKASLNNHGLAYDVQLAVYALYIGQNDLFRNVVECFPRKRLFPQIKPDGSQPLELERTTAFGYTIFNLSHMLDMASIARVEGLDIYHAKGAEGQSVTAALNFIIPYLGKPQSEWPYQQIKEWDKKQEELCWVLRRASFFDPDAGYEALAAKYRQTPAQSTLNLLFSLE